MTFPTSHPHPCESPTITILDFDENEPTCLPTLTDYITDNPRQIPRSVNNQVNMQSVVRDTHDISPTSLHQLYPNSENFVPFVHQRKCAPTYGKHESTAPKSMTSRSGLLPGEEGETEDSDNPLVEQHVEDRVNVGFDTRCERERERERGDNDPFEEHPSTVHQTNVSECVKHDCEMSSKNDSFPSSHEIGDMVSQLRSDTEGGKTCSASDSQLHITENEQSRSTDECSEQSEIEGASSQTEGFHRSPGEGHDVVDAMASNTSASSDDAPKDRETSSMAATHTDIIDTKITHSRSTPGFKPRQLMAASSHFDEEGGLALRRTLSDFVRLESNLGRSKVITTESHASKDIVREMEACSPREESKDSLSKSRVDIDIAESLGITPSKDDMRCDSANELNKTNVSELIHDDFVTELGTVDQGHRDLSMDSSSASLRQIEPPKSGLAHSTPALGSVDSVCSSSDLERIENRETVKASPREIKRTYSSSVDTLVEEDIETLTTTSIQHTIISRTNSNVSHRTTSSLLIGSNESAVCERQFAENLSDVFDIERDPLSASSLDAEGAWREDHSFPRPHSRVKRMYSSSDSSPDSIPDHEECIEIGDSVTEALAHNQWDAYVSECRRCSSTLEGRELERLSKSGRLPHTGFTSSESMGSLPPQSAETSPLLRRNSSRPLRQKSHADGRTRRGMKSALVKKAARLLNFVLGKKSRSDKDNPENQAKMKKRSLSSLLCGRS